LQIKRWGLIFGSDLAWRCFHFLTLEELQNGGARAEVKIEGGLPREMQADAPFGGKHDSLIARFDGPTRIEALELAKQRAALGVLCPFNKS
jgi:hypothetical protein